MISNFSLKLFLIIYLGVYIGRLVNEQLVEIVLSFVDNGLKSKELIIVFSVLFFMLTLFYIFLAIRAAYDIWNERILTVWLIYWIVCFLANICFMSAITFFYISAFLNGERKSKEEAIKLRYNRIKSLIQLVADLFALILLFILKLRRNQRTDISSSIELVEK